MTTIISGAGAPAYGDVLPVAASAPGISFDLAAYRTAHDYPGGVPALALAIGGNANTLQHKVDPRNGTHHLMVREAREMMAVTGDARMLHALAAELGYVAIRMDSDPTGCTVGDVTRLAKEFGDVLQAVHSAVADGRVTPNELAMVEAQHAELMNAGNGLLATLRAMVPRAPE